MKLVNDEIQNTTLDWIIYDLAHRVMIDVQQDVRREIQFPIPDDVRQEVLGERL